MTAVRVAVMADADWPLNKVRHVFGPQETAVIRYYPNDLQNVLWDIGGALHSGNLMPYLASDEPTNVSATVSVAQSLSPPVLTTDSIHPHPAKNQKPAKFGFPWWYSGKESTCQCRGHRFDPCSGRIPRASNNQVRAPQLLKPCEPGACAPQQERPAR